MNLQWQPFIYNNIFVKKHHDQYLLINPDFLDWVRLDEEEYALFRGFQKGRSVKEMIWEVQKKDRILPYKAQEKIKGFLAKMSLNQMVFPTPAPRRIYQERVSSLVVVYVMVTSSCNLACPYCYADAGEPSQGELTMGQIKDIIHDTRALGGERIVFTGGEPLLRCDLFTVAAYAREMGLKTELLTNGILINRHNIQAINEVFDVVGVSLDGSSAAIHEQLRGVGTFQPTMEGIGLLSQHGIPFTLNTVITRLNYQDLPRLAYRAYEFQSTAFKTHQHIPIGRGAHDRLGCSFEQLHEMQDLLVESLLMYGEAGFVEERIKGEHPMKRALREKCGTGRTELFVDSQGNLYPCRMLQVEALQAGNIGDAPLAQLYQRAQVLQYCRGMGLQQLHQCRECPVEGLCAGGCRALHYAYTGDLFTNDPHVCHLLKEELYTNMWLKTGYFPVKKRRLVQ